MPKYVDSLPDTLTLSPVSPEVLLVSPPGYGIIDSGCGRTIVGRETLEEFKQLWKDRGIPIPDVQYELNHFKFGNGERETSESMIRVPVVIAGRQGVIKAAIIVKGRAPLLISRNALQSLQAVVDFGKKRNEAVCRPSGHPSAYQRSRPVCDSCDWRCSEDQCR